MRHYMNRKLYRVGIFAAIILFVGQGIVSAQQANSTLLLQISGDLWSWAGKQPQRRTNWGYNQVPVLSPDGKTIAYKSTAQLAVDAIKRVGSIGGGDLPANLWLMDMATGTATRITEQPDGASFQQAGTPDRIEIRSTPAFSPDSQMLAWTEILIDKTQNPDQSAQLVIYDIAHKSSKIIVPRLPPQYGVPGALQLQWGTPGIAIWSVTSSTDAKGQFAVQNNLLLYDTAGKQLSILYVGEIYEFGWIKDGDRDYLATLGKGSANQPVDQTQWLLIDPLSGRVFGMPGVPEMYSLSAPNGLSLFAASVSTVPDWQIGAPGQTGAKRGALDDVYTFSHAVSISPDGRQVAYVQQGGGYIYTQTKVTRIVPSHTTAPTSRPA